MRRFRLQKHPPNAAIARVIEEQEKLDFQTHARLYRDADVHLHDYGKFLFIPRKLPAPGPRGSRVLSDKWKTLRSSIETSGLRPTLVGIVVSYLTKCEWQLGQDVCVFHWLLDQVETNDQGNADHLLRSKCEQCKIVDARSTAEGFGLLIDRTHERQSYGEWIRYDSLRLLPNTDDVLSESQHAIALQHSASHDERDASL